MQPVQRVRVYIQVYFCPIQARIVLVKPESKELIRTIYQDRVAAIGPL